MLIISKKLRAIKVEQNDVGRKKQSFYITKNQIKKIIKL